MTEKLELPAAIRADIVAHARAEAHYPDAIYVLISLREATPEMRAFRLRDGWVREVSLS